MNEFGSEFKSELVILICERMFDNYNAKFKRNGHFMELYA